MLARPRPPSEVGRGRIHRAVGSLLPLYFMSVKIKLR